MTTPAQIRILDEAEARLRGLKKSNGYDITLAKLTRATLTGFQAGDLPALNYWTGTDEIESRGAGFVTRRLPILVEIYDKNRDRPFVDVAFELAAAVEMALHRAPAAPRVDDRPEQGCGGLLVSLQQVSVTPQIGQGQAPWLGALITYDALYRVRTDGTLVTS